LAVKRAHILSPLIYRLCKNEAFAASFGALDKFCSYIPLLVNVLLARWFVLHLERLQSKIYTSYYMVPINEN
ncbi:MAG: hypothetical protein ABI295_11295, partial [Xanthomarina sp.]